MALHDDNEIQIVSTGPAESLPDPTLVSGRAHWIINAGDNPATWSSVGVTPFQIGGVPVASLVIPGGATRSVRSNGTRWVVDAGPAATMPEGMAVLAAALNLQPTGSGVWTPVALSVNLPEPGVYHLDAVVRMAISASVLIGGTNVWGEARLFDVTAGVVVPGSESICCQVILGGILATAGGNQDGMIAVRHAIAVPSVIRVEAQRTNAAGASSSASVSSDSAGRTTLRYRRVA